MDEPTPAATPGLKPVATVPAPKKKRRGLLVPVLIGIVVLAGGGAAAYWKLRPVPVAAEGAEAPAAEVRADGVVSFEPFLVNLAGGTGQTYLRVTLKLLVSSEGDAKTIEGSEVTKARIRSAILEVLSTQSGDVLVTAAGKAELKKALIHQVSALHQKTEVHDVLFSEFVVQF